MAEFKIDETQAKQVARAIQSAILEFCLRPENESAFEDFKLKLNSEYFRKLIDD